MLSDRNLSADRRESISNYKPIGGYNREHLATEYMLDSVEENSLHMITDHSMTAGVAGQQTMGVVFSKNEKIISGKASKVVQMKTSNNLPSRNTA